MESYSYSRLTRFEECPLSFMRRYLEDETEGKSHGITEFGLFMHKIMEKYALGKLKPEDLVAYYTKHVKEAVKSDTTLHMSATFTKDLYDLYYEGFLQFLINFDGFDDGLIIKDVEKKVSLKYKDFELVGVIDLILEDANGDIYILDHKSKNKFKSKKEQAQYARQLYIYAYFVKEVYGKYPKGLLFNMMRGTVVRIPFKEDDMFAALTWVEDTVAEIRDTITYKANPDTFFCMNWCGLQKDKFCVKEE